jgi:PhnB protein
VTAFDDLRESTDPIAPDPGFAARLRSHVVAALGASDASPDPVRTLPAPDDVPAVDMPERSIAMTNTAAASTPATTSATTSTPATANPLIPYIAVAGAVAAMEWYTDVLGAVETIRYTGDDGRVGHAEMNIGGARLMLSDEYPDYGAVGPQTLGGTSFSLHLTVPDVDATWDRAIARGAAGQRPPTDQPYGERSCTFLDPFGHRWNVGTHIADPTTEGIEAGMEGYTISEPERGAATPDAPIELGYVTMGFDDTARATRFYGVLFGWSSEQGGAGVEYVHIANTQLPMGFTPDGIASPSELYFRVPSVERYAARVIQLGGTVINQSTYESGSDAVCRDDQGRTFHLWQPAPGY